MTPYPDRQLDANALAAEQRAPTLHLGRFTYRGRLLSIEEWLPWWDEWHALDVERKALPADAQPSAVLAHFAKRSAFAERYLRVVFPRRRYPFWAPDPVAALLAQAHQVVEETLGFFFILQARATFGADVVDAVRPPVPPDLEAMAGSDSPARTPVADGVT